MVACLRSHHGTEAPYLLRLNMTHNDSLLTKGLGELERSALRFENYNDSFILPDTFIIVRLDAHRYGDWSGLSEQYPCGESITKAFHATARDLMTASFRVILAYTHGDEISLLLDPSENSNPLRRSKIISAFASAAAIHFYKHTGLTATFDAKVSELPSLDRVLEYLFWQRRYCFRNATTIALRNALMARGHSRDEVEKQTHGISEEQRISKLSSCGIPLNSIPATTRRGALHAWESFARDGREHFKINSDTNLSDDDSQYLNLLQSRLRKALDMPEKVVVVDKSAAARQAHLQTPNSEQSRPAPHRPSGTQRAQEPRRNKKAQVSVFKMPSQ